MTHYKHGMSQLKRDWILIACLYGMIFFMLTAAICFTDNYILRGHESHDCSR